MSNLTPSLTHKLKVQFPDIVSLNVSMATVSHWRIGGCVAALATPRTVEELRQLRIWIDLHQVPSLVIGNTTNLLFADEGVNAIVIQLAHSFSGIQIEGTEIIVKAGTYVPCLARKSMQYGLTGLEHTVGIPATLGGLVCMNGGSQRKGIGSSVVSVTSIDAQGNLRIREREQCEFAYRHSVFHNSREVVLEVKLRLEKAVDRASVRRDMLKILRDRNAKFPRKLPNCGSVFKSNPAMYAEVGPPGAVIELLGFKGMQIGNAQVSPIHSNFIINRGNARATDVISLIKAIAQTAQQRTGYLMEVEARFVTPKGRIVDPLIHVPAK